MKIENMKLFDLQTGKDDFELGKDFWFGGNVIILFENLKRSTNTYSLLDEVNACARFIKQPHTDPIVKEICEKVGAVVYGGRYVLMFSEYDRKIGDVVDQGEYEYHRYGYVAICNVNSIYVKLNGILDIPQFQTECAVGRIDSVDYEVIGNLFEEYSKQLRNEPNKFDELNELLK